MSTAGRFVHLHCHSHYSLLDGASPIDALVEKAQSQGMNALALTDHGAQQMLGDGTHAPRIAQYMHRLAFVLEDEDERFAAREHEALLRGARQGFEEVDGFGAGWLEGVERHGRHR